MQCNKEKKKEKKIIRFITREALDILQITNLTQRSRN